MLNSFANLVKRLVFNKKIAEYALVILFWTLLKQAIIVTLTYAGMMIAFIFVFLFVAKIMFHGIAGDIVRNGLFLKDKD